MKKSPFQFIAGFVCLFALYHAAEYMIVFKNSPAGFLVFQALFFVAAWFIAQWQFKEGLAAWGLGIKKHFLLHLVLGMLMGIILYGATYFVNLVAGIERKMAVPDFQYMAKPLLLFLFGNFFSSLSEDIFTRGYLYRHLSGKLTVPLLVLVSALVFLFNHIYRLGDGVVVYLYLFLMGVMLVLPLILTRRLWFTTGLHWAGNSFFYLTHSIILTKPGSTAFSGNLTLCMFILLMIPLNYYLLKINDLIAPENRQPAKPGLA